MPTKIRCPRCSNEFDIEAVMYSELQERLEKENAEKVNQVLQELENSKKQLNEDKKRLEQSRQREEEIFRERVGRETARIQAEERIRAVKELNVKIEDLQADAKQKAIQLQELQKKELLLLREKTELEQRSKDLEIEIEKRMLEHRKKVEDETIQREHKLFELKMKDKDQQLDGLKKTIEELQRKADQGSSQLQGESQELLLEDMLRSAFPFDTIDEVAKGTEGADCIMLVRNNSGMECGKIIFESKRTKGWSNIWLDKLKTDMRSSQADLAILVTQVFPKGMDCFGERDGVWISSFREVIGLTIALRNAIIRIAETRKAEENKGEKMQMLYDYLTGVEFRQQIEAIVEGFVAMRNSITRERVQMEKMWKEREKQLEKVLLHTSGLYGSIKGIAGASVQEIPMLETSAENGEEE